MLSMDLFSSGLPKRQGHTAISEHFSKNNTQRGSKRYLFLDILDALPLAP